MGTDELREHAPECKRHVDDQPVFIAPKIEDDPVVAHEIDGTAELPLYLGWISPSCPGGNREPGTDRSLDMRVTRPELLQRPTGDHLHGEIISCHRFGDKLVTPRERRCLLGRRTNPCAATPRRAMTIGGYGSRRSPGRQRLALRPATALPS